MFSLKTLNPSGALMVFSIFIVTASVLFGLLYLNGQVSATTSQLVIGVSGLLAFVLSTLLVVSKSYWKATFFTVFGVVCYLVVTSMPLSIQV